MKIWVVLGLLLSAFPLVAEPRLVPDGLIPLEASVPGPLESGILARAALVASGASEIQTAALLQKVDELSRLLQKDIRKDMTEKEKAELVLAFLYRNVLSRYSEPQTRVDVALENGTYNCVSSAILFSVFAKGVGLEVEGVETPDHAFCTVRVGDAKIDVETTNPYGVDPGNRKELSDSEKRTRYVLVPRQKYENRRSVDDRRLVALIYGNRVSALERRGNFAEAVPLAVDSWQLQGRPLPMKELSERFLNYAGNLSNLGRNEEGIAFIEHVTADFGSYPAYTSYLAVAVGNQTSLYLQAGSYEAARALLLSHKAELSSAMYQTLVRDVAFRELHALVVSASLSDSLSALANSRLSLDQKAYSDLYALSYSLEAERTARLGRWLEAASVLDEGLKTLPGRGDLAAQQAVYRKNYAIEVHNRAASAFNAGKKDAAKALIEEGLRLLPENDILLNDQRRMR